MISILFVSNFEGGFQPMTVASGAASLLEAGFDVAVLDTYVDGIKSELFEAPDLVAISIPLFDALFPGIEIARQVREANPKAHITFFGQYATINAMRLVGKYSDTCVVGEWEEPLVALAKYLSGDQQSELPGIVNSMHVAENQRIHPYISRNHFRLPARHLLPPLFKYPQVQIDKLCDAKQIVGSTEIARGCHHKCLYCSVYAAYDGKVIMVPEDIVIQDVRVLVEGGMTHLTFVDADFFNSKRFGLTVLRRLHTEFPTLTYDFTTRVDHILENKETLREMANLNVKFITSALEFPTQEVLDAVAKQTSLEDIEDAVAFLYEIGIKLNPTFIMYNPWVKLEELATFRAFVEKNELEQIIDPIQYETRLHLYKGSPLLHTASIQALELIEHEFHVEWKHPDPRVDELYAASLTPVEEGIFKRCCLKC